MLTQGTVHVLFILKEENSFLSRFPYKQGFHRSGALVLAEKCAQGQTEHVQHIE